MRYLQWIAISWAVVATVAYTAWFLRARSRFMSIRESGRPSWRDAVELGGMMVLWMGVLFLAPLALALASVRMPLESAAIVLAAAGAVLIPPPLVVVLVSAAVLRRRNSRASDRTSH